MGVAPVFYAMPAQLRAAVVEGSHTAYMNGVHTAVLVIGIPALNDARVTLIDTVGNVVATATAVSLHRAGGQSQFSVPLQGPPARSPALRRVVDLVTADPAGPTPWPNWRGDSTSVRGTSPGCSARSWAPHRPSTSSRSASTSRSPF